MIGSLFKELPPIPETETEVSSISEDLSYLTDSDDSLVASLPLVQKIVQRRIVMSWASEAADLVQGIALRLLKWRNKYQDKSKQMSPDEWQDFAARTAYNEINRHYKNNSLINVPLDTVQETASTFFLEGQSEAEVCSLSLEVWQKICSLTLRQRQALLLGSDELVLYFLQCGITDEELAENLNLTIEEWSVVKDRLPLKSFLIAELLRESGNRNNFELSVRSTIKARHEARLKVRRVREK